MSATTQLLSSGEFCKLRYNTIPVQSASANVSFYANERHVHTTQQTYCLYALSRTL